MVLFDALVHLLWFARAAVQYILNSLFHHFVPFNRTIYQIQRGQSTVHPYWFLVLEQKTKDKHGQKWNLGITRDKDLYKLYIVLNVYFEQRLECVFAKQYYKNKLSSFLLHFFQEIEPVDDNFEEHSPGMVSCRLQQVFLV